MKSEKIEPFTVVKIESQIAMFHYFFHFENGTVLIKFEQTE